MSNITFTTFSVQATLGNRKSKTRRVMMPRPEIDQYGMWHWKGCQWMDGGLGFPVSGIEDHEPHKPGDVLYVKETWTKYATIDSFLTDTNLYAYKADYTIDDIPWKWLSSRYMPREAARLFVRVKDVQVERVQDIGERNAMREGLRPSAPGPGKQSARMNFIDLWDELNKKHGFGWDINPWVWVYAFEEIEKQEG